MFFKVMEFLGTVAAFWFTWRVLDWTIGQVKWGKKKDDLTLSGEATVSFSCTDCKKKEERVVALQRQTETLDRQIAALKATPQSVQYQQTLVKYQQAYTTAQAEITHLKDEVHRLKMLLPSILNILNEAPKEKLKEIRGIGRRRSDAIISSRPFADIQDAEKKLGGKTLAVVLKWLDPEFKENG